MKVGDVTRHVISNSQKRKMIGDRPRNTQEVVYKTYMGKHGGKPYYSSQTRHEAI